MAIWQKSLLVRGNSSYEGLGVEECLAFLWSSDEVRVVGEDSDR